MLFDQPYYQEINRARWEAATQILDRIGHLQLRSCLDLGCGPGWFSSRLAGRGLEVTGVDGRTEVLQAARERCGGATFRMLDLDAGAVETLPPADLVFCFGLLYHLESPLAFIRRVRALTRRVLLLETIVAPGQEPTLRLVEEGRNETQGLTYCSLTPTLPALAKMLGIAGFESLYTWSAAIGHDDFREDETRLRRRRIVIAFPRPLSLEPPFLALEVPAAPKISFLR